MKKKNREKNKKKRKRLRNRSDRMIKTRHTMNLKLSSVFGSSACLVKIEFFCYLSSFFIHGVCNGQQRWVRFGLSFLKKVDRFGSVSIKREPVPSLIGSCQSVLIRELHRTPKPDSDSDGVGARVGVGVGIGIEKKFFSESESGFGIKKCDSGDH